MIKVQPCIRPTLPDSQSFEKKVDEEPADREEEPEAGVLTVSG
jgi:hypothetical protein